MRGKVINLMESKLIQDNTLLDGLRAPGCINEWMILTTGLATTLDWSGLRDGLTGGVVSLQTTCGDNEAWSLLSNFMNSTSTSESSLNSWIVFRPGSILTLASTDLSMLIVDDSLVVRSSVEHSNTDSETPYTRYFPVFNNQNKPTSFSPLVWRIACETRLVWSSKTSSTK